MLGACEVSVGTGDSNPYQSPRGNSRLKERRRWRPSVVEIIVIIAVVCIVAWLLLPAFQQTRVYSPRTSCWNNLKQIGFALHNYHDDYGAFPPSFVAGPDGQPAHSWRILLLPYLDQQALYDRYDFSEPWDSAGNIQLQDSMPTVYRCRSFLAGIKTGSLQHQHLSRLSSYVAVVAQDGVFCGDDSVSLQDISDGPEDTLMVAETHQHAVHWMSPVDVTPGQLLTDVRVSAFDSKANHRGCINAGYADGSCRAIPSDADETKLRELITISGGEDTDREF